MKWTLFGLLLCLFCQADQDKSIRFSIAESWSEPYAFFDNKKNLVGGAMKELIDNMAKKLNQDASYVYLSRNRIDAASEKKQIDVRCYMSESWTEKPELYDWSKPVFNVSNSVIWKKGRSPITKLTDLESKKLGTVSGYIYKTIDAQMKAGKVIRSDVPNEQMNLSLIQKDRLDYAIVGTAAFNWILRKGDASSLKEIESFVIDSTPTKCAVLKAGRIKVKDLDEAIDRLRNEGFIRKIRTKYEI